MPMPRATRPGDDSERDDVGEVTEVQPLGAGGETESATIANLPMGYALVVSQC